VENEKDVQDGNDRCLRRRCRSMKLTTNGQTMTKATVGMFQLAKRRRHHRDAPCNSCISQRRELWLDVV